MPTPHISAQPGDFADCVLMPGDPLRAQFIAENYLEDIACVNEVRNMLGYTGTYKGKKISVMGSGMGVPSISIYAKELITDYGVKSLIRIGSCGATQRDINTRDLLIGMGASTDSGVNRTRFEGYDFAAIADFDLLKNATDAAAALNVPVRVGNMFSADLFYQPDTSFFQLLEKMGILAVEMEAAGLYGVAAEFGAKALCIATVSDHILTGEALDSEQRQTSFHEMMQVALESVLLQDK